MGDRETGGPALDRRRVLLGLGAAAGMLATPSLGFAAPIIKRQDQPRRLAFNSLHTGEKVDVIYFEKGRYHKDALAEIDRVLRDHRTGDVVSMDRDLLDTLWELRRRLDTNRPFDLISGYRSPKTNAMLASQSDGVAKKSYHTRAMATDIAVPGIDLAHVRKAALALQRGGVGYYPKSGFVHVDVGRVRFW